MKRPTRMFAFRLALALGYPHPDHLLRQLTPRQLDEWRAFDLLEPSVGPYRADLHAGIVASTLVGIHVPKGKKGPKAEDFIPKFKLVEKMTPQKQQTIEQQKDMARRLAAAFGVAPKF